MAIPSFFLLFVITWQIFKQLGVYSSAFFHQFIVDSFLLHHTERYSMDDRISSCRKLDEFD